MNRKVLQAVSSALESYHGRFERFFMREEPREQSRKYLQGLISAPDRRNGWELAEVVGDTVPDPTQRLLYRSHWDVNAVLDEHVRFAKETVGDPAGVFIVDETGFLKSGSSSAGVQRQYTGTAGKITNCQVGVFLGYSSVHGSLLLDRRLYMPAQWINDSGRCRRAKVPEGLSFLTKPQQALEMLHHAIDELHVPGSWVVGDEVYGNNPEFRCGVDNLRQQFVLAVSKTTLVGKMPHMAKGRKKLAFWLEGEALTVENVAAQIPASYWQRLATTPGERGPIKYAWASVRVVTEVDGECWLLIRQSLADCTDRAYYLSNADETTPLLKLAEVALRRATIEQCFAEAKTETGLDEYEVRLWEAWYRHITLAMMAHSLLVSVKKTQIGPTKDLRTYRSRHGKASSDTNHWSSTNKVFSGLARV